MTLWLGFKTMIFALATPVGKSAIAVIRVAGEGCHKKINASLDKPIMLLVKFSSEI